MARPAQNGHQPLINLTLSTPPRRPGDTHPEEGSLQAESQSGPSGPQPLPDLVRAEHGRRYSLSEPNRELGEFMEGLSPVPTMPGPGGSRVPAVDENRYWDGKKEEFNGLLAREHMAIDAKYYPKPTAMEMHDRIAVQGGGLMGDVLAGVSEETRAQFTQRPAAGHMSAPPGPSQPIHASDPNPDTSTEARPSQPRSPGNAFDGDRGGFRFGAPRQADPPPSPLAESRADLEAIRKYLEKSDRG